MIIETIRNLFNRLCLMYDVDIEQIKNKNEFSGTFSEYDKQKMFTQIVFFIDSEKYDKAIILMNELIKTCSFSFKYDDLDNQKKIDDFYVFYDLLSEIKRTYNDYVETEFTPQLSTLSNSDLFNIDEITIENYSPEHYAHSERENIFKYFKLYSIKGNNQDIDFSNGYDYNSNIIITSDISLYLNNHNKNVDKPLFEVLFVLDEPMVYSYFIIICSYKDSTYACSDMIIHENPRTKVSSRNPSRKIESKFDNTFLPYDKILIEIDELRKNNTTVNPNGVNFEFYVKSIKDYCNVAEKMFILELFNHISTEIVINKPTIRLYTKQSVISENLLLSDGTDMVNKYVESDFVNWDKEVIERQKEIFAMFEEDGTDLIRLNTDLALNYIDNNYLLTKESYDKLLKWTMIENERVEFVNKYLTDDKEGKIIEDTKKEIRELLSNNIDNILNKISSYDEIYLTINDNDSSGFENKEKLHINKLILDKGKESTIFSAYNPLYKWDTKARKVCSCQLCNKHSLSYVVVIKITHYKELMWLLDIKDKKELPRYSRAFKNCQYRVYNGNSITSNVNPLSLIKDPISDEFANGIKISFNMCKSCWNNLVKENKKGSKITISL